MRFITKLLALPFVLLTGLMYLICKVFTLAAGTVVGWISGLVFLGAVVLFFVAGFWEGLSWLVIAFLLSPYGLPMVAAWITGKIGGVNYLLRDFLAS